MCCLLSVVITCLRCAVCSWLVVVCCLFVVDCCLVFVGCCCLLLIVVVRVLRSLRFFFRCLLSIDVYSVLVVG